MEELKARPMIDCINTLISDAEGDGLIDAGEISDGFHTFDDLYHQRLILFAALVRAYPDRSWKSKRHDDGQECFGGEWFIVGIDTPEGCYTYHYELGDWDLFQCVELPKSKAWDGHTSKDVSRVLSLARGEYYEGNA